MSNVTQKSSTAGWPVEQGQIRFSSFVGDCQKLCMIFSLPRPSTSIAHGVKMYTPQWVETDLLARETWSI